MADAKDFRLEIQRQIGKMHVDALAELPANAQKSLVCTSSRFVRELKNGYSIHESAIYGMSFGVNQHDILCVIRFLNEKLPVFMTANVFDINTPGMEKLIKHTGYLFFVRLNLSIPLALALLLPELEKARL